MATNTKKKPVVVASNSAAKFPYTTKPGSLRKFLQTVPQKPKPTKIDKSLVQSWGFRDSNDMTMLRVLKGVKLVSDNGEPTERYVQFMSLRDGAKALAAEIRKLYEPLFQVSHKPFSESNEQLKNWFNIHSGGGERSIEYQIQTFKALCDNADFDGTIAEQQQGAGGQIAPTGTPSSNRAAGNGLAPGININLHIHLPENKSRRDYEAMIEDIGRYIFGRESGQSTDG